MNAQEIFDKVATHLFAQGVRAYGLTDPVTGDTNCLYRGPNGTKCAVGVLIPDEDYDDKIEEMSADDAIYLLAPKSQTCASLRAHDKLLSTLQDAHDDEEYWQSTAQMRKALRSVADWHDLNPAILDTLSFKDR